MEAPKGSVDWEAYAVRSLPRGAATRVPCRFPDQRDDEPLRSAIHHVLREHRASLESQRSQSIIVRALIALGDELLAKVSGTPPRPGNSPRGGTNRRSHVRSPRGWRRSTGTLEEPRARGAERAGRPVVAARHGAVLRGLGRAAGRTRRTQLGMQLLVGRRGQTRVGLEWSPPWSGSLGSLVPDRVMRRDDLTSWWTPSSMRTPRRSNRSAGARWTSSSASTTGRTCTRRSCTRRSSTRRRW